MRLAKRLVLSLALCAPLLSMGCPKKDATATKDDEKSTKAAKESGYARGDVLHHVPEKCGAAWIYFDLAAIRKLEAVDKNLDAMQDKAVDSAGSSDAKKMKKALKAMSDAGIDPKKDMQEMAICAGDDKSVVVAIGGSVKGKDVLEGIQNAIEATGEAKVEKKKKKGLSYLKVDEALLAMVSDTVLVVTLDEDTLADLSKEGDVGKIWSLEDGRLVSGGFVRKKGGDKDVDLTGSIDASGDDLLVAVTAKAKTPEAKKALEEDGDDVKKEIKDKILGSFADVLEKIPAKGLADDLRDAKVTVGDGAIKGKLTVHGKNLTKAVDKLMAMDPEEIEKLFR
jgi:hypothetical protein